MNLEFNFNIAISAAVGTALVEIIFKLFLNHWLDRLFYKFKLKISDKRACADEILEMISSRNYTSWSNLSHDIYNKEYDLSDRLITIGEQEASDKLDKYANERRYLKETADKIFDITNPTKDLDKDFIETHHRIDDLHDELVRIAKQMKR